MDARLSRYSYLVSLLPRRVMADLDLDVRLVRRRYSSYTPLPATPGTGLLVDNEGRGRATAAAFAAVTGSGAEHEGVARFYGRMVEPGPAGLPDRPGAAAVRRGGAGAGR